MARECPLCPSVPLRAVHAQGLEVELCPRCEGLWFERAQLALFNDRALARSFLTAARMAPARCRKQGHLVPRAMAACATCKSLPVSCPSCKDRLALVTTPSCAVDLCLSCEGIWLDHGELALLQQDPSPSKKAKAPAAPGGWDLPEAHLPAQDLWKAPGSEQALEPPSSSRFNSRTSLQCRHCATELLVRDAWAFDGDLYCGNCRPEGAVSGSALPNDPLFPDPFAAPNTSWGDTAFGELSKVLTRGSFRVRLVDLLGLLFKP